MKTLLERYEEKLALAKTSKTTSKTLLERYEEKLAIEQNRN